MAHQHVQHRQRRAPQRIRPRHLQCSTMAEDHPSIRTRSSSQPSPSAPAPPLRIRSIVVATSLLAYVLVAGSSSICNAAATTHSSTISNHHHGLLSPISLGLRSALAHRNGRAGQLWGTATTRNRSRAFTDQFVASPRMSGSPTAAPNNPQQQQEPEVESAFFFPQSLDDVVEMRSAETAHLRTTVLRPGASRSNISKKSRKSRASDDEDDELDFIESSMLGGPSRHSPLSMRDMVQVSTSKAPAATAVTHAKQRSSNYYQNHRGGAAAAVEAVTMTRPLAFWESMICGAISRSVAQTTMHPANTMKTILQNGSGFRNSLELLRPQQWSRLWVGAGANFLLSVPHGAVNFAVLEMVRKQLGTLVKRTPYLAEREQRWGAGLDFLSSSISTVACSVVSTPQMMITDNIMVGNYPNLLAAIRGLASAKGISGFYAGWWPGLVGKIPSYALTWTLYQQTKKIRDRISDHAATDFENSAMGCIASGTTVCLMIPLDTIKTRLVTQTGRAASEKAYKGILDCAVRVAREEGIRAFYRGLPPRLVSVVPMIGIQFGVYEFMKKTMMQRNVIATQRAAKLAPEEEEEEEAAEEYNADAVLEEAMMEVAADPEQPFPAPHLFKRILKTKESKKKRKQK